MKTLAKSKFAAVLVSSCFIAACSSNPKVVEPTLGAAQTGIVDTPRGPSLMVDNVLFDFEQSSLRSEADATLSKAVAYLKANPTRTALIEGHTDVTGDEKYNHALSLQRSESVKNALVNQGISVSRIKTYGLGESQPIADNGSLSGRQSNRRVEIIFSQAN